MGAQAEFDPGTLARAARLLRRGGAVVLLLAMLAVSLALYASYQARVQLVHGQAFDRMMPVQETLDYESALIDVFLRHTAGGHGESQKLLPVGGFAAAAGLESVDLATAGMPSQVGATLWRRPGAEVDLDHVGRVMFQAYGSVKILSWRGASLLIDRRGEYLASYPSAPRPPHLSGLLQWARQLPALPEGKTQWAVFRLGDQRPCDCVAAYIGMKSHGRDEVFVQTWPLAHLDALFAGQGWFALQNGGQTLYASAGAEPERWAGATAARQSGLTETTHRGGKLLLKEKLTQLPWTLLYSPSRAGEPGAEWQELVPHAFAEVGLLLALLWFYLTLRRLMLRPTEDALAAVLHYQQALHASNRSLQDAKELAEQASQARSLFLAVMSHEIRTPLNGVMAMLELLEREPLTPAQHEYLAMIKTSSSVLLHIISDVLIFTRLQTGRVEFVAEPVAIRQLVSDLLDAQRAAIEVAGKAVICDLRGPQDPGLLLWLDPYRIQQILGNLLSNAVKFTEQGTICVQLDYSQGWLQVDVADTGIGMSAAQISRLFQPFAQADASTVRQYGGSGLGLAIIKQLLDQCEGSVTVDSRPGEGSRFRVRLPCEPAPREALGLRSPAVEPSATVPRRAGVVWVVEDHPINRAALQAQFRSLGADACFAASGDEALRKMRDSAPIALVLTDIAMPEMDGFELTRRLQADPAFASLPIVALSAHAFPSDVQAGRQAGMADYLTKPVSLEALRAMLSRFGVAMHVADEAAVQPAAEVAAGPDIGALLDLFQNRMADVRDLLERFLLCDAEDRAKLQRAWQEQHPAQLASVAHRMGSAALYIDGAYAELLYALEAAAEQADMVVAGERLSAVLRTSAALAAACRAWLESR